MATPPSTASEILEAAGVPEDHEFYREFTTEREKAVLTVPQRIQAAWLANDADAFAGVFAENGSLLMQDDQLTSREEIRSYMAAGFQGPYRGAHVNGWPLQVDFLSEDAAMVITQGGIILAGESEIAPERQIRAIWVIVRQDGEWRLFSHQSSPIKG
ncbi:MAG: SgcJ/EcaC family oxidoreductase [Pseudonocardiaceae bacterium]|nr:SgcJ/EcaC family oxidoreductase [Pseudonocardiaceae bacterium]